MSGRPTHPPSGRVPGFDERDSWSVAKRLSYRECERSSMSLVHRIAGGKLRIAERLS
jgi:hypothetical protein